MRAYRKGQKRSYEGPRRESSMCFLNSSSLSSSTPHLYFFKPVSASIDELAALAALDELDELDASSLVPSLGAESGREARRREAIEFEAGRREANGFEAGKGAANGCKAFGAAGGRAADGCGWNELEEGNGRDRAELPPSPPRSRAAASCQGCAGLLVILLRLNI